MTMRRLLSGLIIAALVWLAELSAVAGPETRPRMNLSDYCIDPVADSISMSEFRSYLDSIRKERPTVALVLSGGGAKGASHIGVIHYLDSLKIPVDVVLGTSMGGLVGALYSLGYTAHEMDSLIRTIDWSMALSDRVPRDYVSYSQKKYKEKILLSFPFYYAKQDYLDRKAAERGYETADHRHGELRLGAGKDDAVSVVKDNLLSSLPSGLAYGQNVNNLLSSLTVGYQNDMNFIDLPVPFVCVATDMVTAKPKIWYRGGLKTAMRSTMSIPGVFAPVKVDGMVLVDGGMRNNYPADLAMEMGADIIIGVDLSSGYRTYGGLNDLKDIIGQGVDMLGRESYEKNVSIPDVTVKPDLHEYNMMSFDDKSIDVIIRRGLEASEAVSDQLDSILALTGAREKVLRNKKAIDLGTSPVLVSKIEITGVTEKESRYLMGRIKIRPADYLCREDIEDAVATIFGTGAFDYVTYEMEGSGEPFNLLIHCRRGPVHQFGIGGRVDSEEVASLLINIGLNAHKLQGAALNFYGKVGINPYASLTCYVSAPSGPTFNLGASVKWLDRNRFTLGESDYNVAYLNVREEIYLSNIRLRKFDAKFGIRSDFYKMNKIMATSVTGNYDLDMLTNNYVSAFLDLKADTFDDGYFPTKGVSWELGYDWVFAGLRKKIDGFHIANLDFKAAVSAGCFTFLPSVSARFIMGGEPSLPYLNLIGGFMPGRYLDQQIPFAGVNYAMAMHNYLAMVRGDFRFRLFKNNYITLCANYAYSVRDLSDVKDTSMALGLLGAGLKYSYNSIIGPVDFGLHWRSRNSKVGAFLNFGLYF